MSEPSKDGGAAFPIPTSETSQGGHPEQYGMALRDYFAAQAVSGVIACIHPMKIEPAANDKLAAMAYAIADALLAAREVKHG